MDLLTPPKIPTVAALPAAGSRGRMLTLSTDGHLYHDNGTTWDDLTAQGAPSQDYGLITGTVDSSTDYGALA